VIDLSGEAEPEAQLAAMAIVAPRESATVPPARPSEEILRSRFSSIDWAAHGVKRAAAQWEVCPRTRRWHLQGYVQFASVKSFTQVKDLLWQGTHIESAKGSVEQNQEYCTKADSRAPTELAGPFFYGDRTKGQGSRTDVWALKASVDAGVSKADMWDQHWVLMLRNHRAVGAYLNDKFTGRQRQGYTSMLVLCGPPGRGKTEAAALLAEKCGSVYMLPFAKGSGLYWEGYRQQDVVMVDEMDGHRMQRSLFLLLGGRLPVQVPVHGGQVEFNSPLIIFTSNHLPKSWWARKHGPVEAVERRVVTLNMSNASRPHGLVPFLVEQLGPGIPGCACTTCVSKMPSNRPRNMAPIFLPQPTGARMVARSRFMAEPSPPVAPTQEVLSEVPSDWEMEEVDLPPLEDMMDFSQ